jgi:hypothetical protein
MLESLTEEADLCCRKAFAKEADKGALDALESWVCPKCGCEYRVQLTGAIRYWAYVCDAVVIRNGK